MTFQTEGEREAFRNRQIRYLNRKYLSHVEEPPDLVAAIRKRIARWQRRRALLRKTAWALGASVMAAALLFFV